MNEERRIGAVALWVSDLELSAAFYREIIGIALEHSGPHEPENVPHYETMWGAWDDQGPVEPYLWFNLYAATGKPTTGLDLGISVPSLDEVHQRAISAGVKVIKHPAAGTFGGRSATYEDPDGNVVTISGP